MSTRDFTCTFKATHVTCSYISFTFYSVAMLNKPLRIYTVRFCINKWINRAIICDFNQGCEKQLLNIISMKLTSYTVHISCITIISLYRAKCFFDFGMTGINFNDDDDDQHRIVVNTIY